MLKIGVDEVIIFGAKELRQGPPSESSKLLKLLSLPITPPRARDVDELHYFVRTI